MSLILVLLGLLSCVILYYYRSCKSPTARIAVQFPGPKPYPIIGNGLEFGHSTVDIFNNLKRLWKEHGSVYRLWLGPMLFLVVADAKYAETLLNSTVNISKSILYKFVEPWLGKGLLTSTGSKWKRSRRIITPTFHFKILEDYVDVFNDNGICLVEHLKKHADGEEFNIYNHITLCALDIIYESAMGVKMNLQNNGNSNYVIAVKGISDVIMRRAFSPWLYSDIIFNMNNLGKRHHEYLKVLHGTTEKVIAKRKEELRTKNEENPNVETENECGQKKRMAFLDLLLQYSKDGANLTDDEIRDEVDTFMFEGHDTTASGITFCLWVLANHPDIQERAYKELYDIFGTSNRECNSKDLQDMKYLEQVIKEAQRFFPSVPLFARELDKDMEIDGLLIPSGTNIIVTPVFMHHDADYFPEPEKFDPDRFSADAIHNRNPYAYIPFSAGPRNCIGQKFAMMEVKATVSKVLRNFKITPGSKEIILSAELVLRSWEGVFVRLETRK